jgi:hypothetical protein
MAFAHHRLKGGGAHSEPFQSLSPSSQVIEFSAAIGFHKA